jgi:large subunit ribosomal protein L21
MRREIAWKTLHHLNPAFRGQKPGFPYLDGSAVFAYPLRTMIAVIKAGGKQYIAREGQTLKLEAIAGTKAGDVVEFEVLLRADEDGTKVEVGTPTLSSAVKGEVVEHGRSAKIEVVKYKPKVRYKKRVGHRQPFTKVKITKV